MKHLNWILLMLFALGSWTGAFAERGSLPPGDSVVNTKALNTTNLPATYGAAGNQYSALGVGHSNLCIVNGAATKLYATTSATATCTGASDKWVVPASAAACFENTRLNKYVCLRSSSGTLSTSVDVDVVIW